MSIKIFKDTNKYQIIPFLLLSLVLHLGLIFTSSALRFPLKKPFSFPIPVEIIELPPIPTGKVEEPREVKRLAQSAQRVERETAPPVLQDQWPVVSGQWPEKEPTREEPPVVLPQEEVKVEPPPKAPEGPKKEEKAVIITEDKSAPTVVATTPEEGEKPRKEAPAVLPKTPAREEKEAPSTIPEAPLKEEKVEPPPKAPEGPPAVVATAPKEEKEVRKEKKVEIPKEEKAVKERDIKLFPSQERLAELEREYQNKAEGVEEGKTLSLDTSEFRYVSYLTGIKRKIELVWGYPDVAARAGQQGKLELRFTIRKDGGLEDIRLIKSSGYPILDDEALSAVRLAAPFNPFPKGFNVERINIVATFEYIIETFYYRRVR